MTGAPPIRTRPGAPAPRPSARFHTADAAGSYTGPVLGAACGNCAKVDRRKGPLGRREWRCGPAVAAAASEDRRLPNTVSPGRPACSRYKPAGSKRGRR